MKKVVRIQLFASIFLLLTGCAIEKENPVSETEVVIEATTEIDKEPIIETITETNKEVETESSVEKPFTKASVIEEDSLYFKRDYNTNSLSPDDLILTLEEKGMKPLSSSKEPYFDVLYFCGNQDEQFLDLLEVPFCYTDAYLNEGVTARVLEHENTYLYNAQEDTIYWERLKEVIKRNTQELIEHDKEYENDEDNELLYKGIEELSDEDLDTVIQQLKTVTMDIKKKYPTYDMAHLACLLENLSLDYHTKINVFNSDALATTSDDEITWLLDEEGCYLNLKTAVQINEHEFKHLLSEPCPDEVNGKDTFVVPSGIECQDSYIFSYRFIEEATAEEFAVGRNSKELLTYLEYHEILDNIRFVLSLQEDYEIDGFLKYGLLQNPIAMIQQFPVLEDRSYMFVDNLEMLVGYDSLLNPFPYEFISEVEKLDGYEDYYLDETLRSKVYSSVANSSQIQLLRLFLTNLLCFNENHPETPLEYNFYLMRLFEKRMNIGFDALSNWLATDLMVDDYEKSYENGKQIFFYYLVDKTNIPYQDMEALYQEYSLTDVSYPSFVGEEKREFYRQLEAWDYQAQKEKKKTFSYEQYYLK